MKKFRRFIWGGIAAVAIGGFAMFNVSLNSQSNSSSISLLNIEALATCESPVITDWGRKSPLLCTNGAGETYTLDACDFASYTTRCEGRSVK
jgi:hypothetical protein